MQKTNFTLVLKLPSLALAVLLLAPNANAALTCDEQLVGPLYPLPKGIISAEIVSAEVVPAAAEPEHCNVVGQLDADPTDPSQIGFRMKLPLNWNHKFLFLGGGGFEGDLSDFSRDRHNNNSTPALERGYAIGVTDTGHTGSIIPQFFASWALDDPVSPGIDNEREINWAYRGTHLATLVMKYVVELYFGSVPEYSYYLGASNSGRTGFIEAGLYPGDFEGIIAASPVVGYSSALEKFTAIQQAQFPFSPSDAPVLPNEKFALITEAVLSKCDALDGIVDGLLDDPRRCKFDAKRDLPRCADEIDAPGCLTAAQRDVLSTILANGVEPGGEPVSWSIWLGQFFLAPIGPNVQYRIAEEAVRYIIDDDPSASLVDFRARSRDFALLSPTDAPKKLKPFFERDGKLIIWVGWLDPAATPREVIEYYEKLTDDDAEADVRLFMVPGQTHGVVPGKFFQGADFLTALEGWVEMDQAPESVTATSVYGSIMRPLCPYPQVARRINTDLPDPNLGNYRCVVDEDEQ